MSSDYPEDYIENQDDANEEPVIGNSPPVAKTLFSNKAYDQTKFVAQILLPALATFYASFGAIWGFPKTEEVVGSIIAFDLFLGALLSLSNAQFRNNPNRFDGTMYVKKDTNMLGDTVLKAGYAIETPAEVLENKNEVVLKVEEAPDDLLR